jgi:CubicO group peptidase (beta-lactamase class C family)
MGFGRTSIVTGRGVNGETLFEIGSITKTFTGLLLAMEIRRGALSLDEPLSGLLPDGRSLPAGMRAATLRHLVTHSSGLPRLPGKTSSMIAGALRMLAYGADPYEGLTVGHYLEALQGAELEFVPGSRTSYSNFGFTLLGLLLARHASRDYEEMVRTDIALPLGMKNTVIDPDAAQSRTVATGYRAFWKFGPLLVGLRSHPWISAKNVEGAGGLLSTGRDMLAYLHANMRPDSSPLGFALRRAHEKLLTIKAGRSQAMGWVILTLKNVRTPILWHNGGTGGSHSFIGFDQSGRHGVLVLSNSGESVDELAMRILQKSIESAQRDVTSLSAP